MERNRAARLHTMSRGSMERHLEAAGIEEDQRFSLLLLAETFRSVSLPHYEDMDDAWGGHRSLTLMNNQGTEYSLILENHPHY
jgi:hypothetical protein